MTRNRGEVIRIAVSMTVACALGSAILGGVYVATSRYAEAARVQFERRAITEMLSLDAAATVLEVRQFLAPAQREVIYRANGPGGGKELAFTLDGKRVNRVRSAEDAKADEKSLKPLGRLFVASRNGAPAGFVVEGETRGYKNRIRFFVALDSQFRIAGVRVVEHEEDPGLGAEIAKPWFQGQYEGRPADGLSTLDVTRDPMPEDWRAALLLRGKTARPEWQSRYGPLQEREAARPIYAVTGATISSRALTDGVRSTVDHFRRRWALIEPYLAGGKS
jgi:electron transport complex protein RnfG